MKKASPLRMVSLGKSPALELKRTTRALREAMESVRAILNSAGGCAQKGTAQAGARPVPLIFIESLW
ncbi:MAG: hypothetical protein HYR55_20560 [Acidobacteria bacterium]|nr:hypothetical protein [Acidobacteriota bacterium]MBI3658622.1 hypothetical protein [Acidobacteriota bacterium]